jgi:hypothetical protein
MNNQNPLEYLIMEVGPLLIPVPLLTAETYRKKNHQSFKISGLSRDQDKSSCRQISKKFPAPQELPKCCYCLGMLHQLLEKLAESGSQCLSSMLPVPLPGQQN